MVERARSLFRKTDLMNQRTHCYVVIACLIGAWGCDGGEATNAIASDPLQRFDRQSNELGPTTYSGDIRPGQFVVCTSRFSPTGLYHYTLEIVNALPSDEYASTLTQANGTCDVVFTTRRRGGPAPILNVAPQTTFIAIDLWDYRSLSEGFYPDVGYKSVEILSVPPEGLALTGIEGAVARFYYYPLSPGGVTDGGTGQCPFGAIVPSALCPGGNHGGTGTLEFGFD